MVRARRRLPLNTLDPRPKGQSLAMATASSSVENLTTAVRRGKGSRALAAGVAGRLPLVECLLPVEWMRRGCPELS